MPQVPSAHEDSTPTPAASTTSRMERSGGTVRVRPLRGQLDVERLGPHGRAHRPGGEPLQVQRGRRPPRAPRPRPRRAAARARSSRRACRAPGCRAGSRGRAGPVSSWGLTVTRSPYARQLVEERHRRPGAAAVDEPPLGARRLGRGDHRQDRRDADAARDEEVARRGHEREVVARPAHPHDVARGAAGRGRAANRRRRPRRAGCRGGRRGGRPRRRTASTAGSAPRRQDRGRRARPAPTPGSGAPSSVSQRQRDDAVGPLVLGRDPDLGLQLAGDARSCRCGGAAVSTWPRGSRCGGFGDRERQVQVLPHVHVRRGPVALGRRR